MVAVVMVVMVQTVCGMQRDNATIPTSRGAHSKHEGFLTFQDALKTHPERNPERVRPKNRASPNPPHP